jgi:signal peptidase II
MSQTAPPAEPSSGTGRAVSVGRRRAAILALAGIVVALDQVTKTWALHHAVEPRHVIWTLRLALTFNSGAAFGLGQGSTAVLVGGAIVLVVVLVGFGRRASRHATVTTSVAMGLLLGGAVGNLVDRLIRHNHSSVIDFIDLRWWPVFNLADASITVGALLLALAGVMGRPKPARSG